MKKYLAITAAFLFALLVTTDYSFAQGKGANSNMRLHQNQPGVNFVDADGDGICDNEPVGSGKGNQGKVRPNFIDADGDGVCDNESSGAGKRNQGKVRPNFVDADGDGVCDNYPNGGSQLRDGSGTQEGSAGKMRGRRGR